MATQILNFANSQNWQLAATGAATVIVSSLNGPGEFWHSATNNAPAQNIGHPIGPGESLTFNVKAGEFLFVRPDGAGTTIVVTT